MWYESQKYDFRSLDAFFNFIGYQIDIEIREQGREKDDEYPVDWAYLEGITVGEYIYTVFEILSEMTSDDPAKDAHYFKDAVLASLIFGMRDRFMEGTDEDDATDILNLYTACCRNDDASVSTDENEREMPPPALAEIDEEGWERIFDIIDLVLIGDNDWQNPVWAKTNFGLADEQPHFPTLQEYRRAKTWLLEAYANTRSSAKAASRREEDV